MGSVSVHFMIVVVVSLLLIVDVVEGVPTTLEGPFKPVTVPLDNTFRGNALDLPDTHPLVQRTVEGFQPEQISVSLSSSHHFVWISWIT
ncbi:Purple acid phosphatase 15, partial [Stylosanthes scabra]|nr:Purple acid phosphatase 15 [Stylosanthes scabra]